MNVTIVLSWIVALLWIALVVWVAYAALRSYRKNPLKPTVPVAIALGLAAIILTVFNSGLVFIQPQERGVVISALAPDGYRQETLQPGLSWVTPFFESVQVYPISYQTYTMSIATEEGQIAGDDSIAGRRTARRFWWMPR